MHMEDNSRQKLLNYAMRALSRRAHTEEEMRIKLRKRKEHRKELEDAVISRLKELNFINDDSLVRSLLESAAEYRLQGHIKVAARLHKKGIPFSKTETLWQEMNINEREIAKKAIQKAQKRFKNLPRDKKFQTKARFLASRGFSPEIIFELASKEENA